MLAISKEKITEEKDGQDARPPKGWYRRGHKHPPHFDGEAIMQFVTFRLANSMPEKELIAWKAELKVKQITDSMYHERIEAYLDQGRGACWLRDPEIARVVQDALLYFDGERYDLWGWVIMPNHVHTLFTQYAGHRLPDILHSWKSFTSKQALKVIFRRTSCPLKSGRRDACPPPPIFWQDDYFDRFIRDENDFGRTLQYIANNPLSAGLCEKPDAYEFMRIYLYGR
ncbi:MAG: transposase [Planctomycetota bacterium]